MKDAPYGLQLSDKPGHSEVIEKAVKDAVQTGLL